MEELPVFITDIKSSHNFTLFHKDLRSTIANSTGRNLTKDNLQESQSVRIKVPLAIFDKLGEFKILSFVHLSKSAAKKRSFFIFF